MIRYTNFPCARLVSTDPPSTYTLTKAIDAFMSALTRNERIAPIILARFQPKRVLILDGNHRAYLLARRGLPIPALMLTSESDRDEILNLEAQHKIPRFPHREYLMSRCSLANLAHQAELKAQEFGIRTIADLLLLDIDKIGSVPAVKLSGATYKDVPFQAATTPDTYVKCKPQHSLGAFLVIYDGKTRKLLPVLACQLEEAKRSGYELITGAKMRQISPKKVQEDVAWAAANFEDLDGAVRGLIMVLPSSIGDYWKTTVGPRKHIAQLKSQTVSPQLSLSELLAAVQPTIHMRKKPSMRAKGLAKRTRKGQKLQLAGSFLPGFEQ
jgi:hypothetical protein